MKLEDQVCSLALAKSLKELGIEQESLFYWQFFTGHDFVIHDVNKALNYDTETYSAFTVAELGEMLPKAVSIVTEDEDKKIFSNFRLVTGRSLIIEEVKPVEVWSINYICDTTNEFRNWLFDLLLTKPMYDKNEANARAKMIIHLMETKLWKP